MDDTDIVTAPESASASGLMAIGSESFHEFIRYGFASAAALVIDAGLLWLLTDVAGMSYLFSGALSFVAGLILVYILSVYWVFAERALHNRTTEFFVFALIGIVGLAFNEAILYLFTSVFGLYYLVSKIASVIVVFTWNFTARKYVLFRSKHT